MTKKMDLKIKDVFKKFKNLIQVFLNLKFAKSLIIFSLKNSRKLK